MSSVVDQQTVAGRGDRFVTEFDVRVRQGQPGVPAWLRDVQAGAMAWFAGTGFPTTRQEDWRFTPVTPIANTAFVTAERLHVLPQSLAEYAFGEETSAELVFVNGVFAPELSRGAAEPGLTAGSLPEGAGEPTQTPSNLHGLWKRKRSAKL